MMLSENFSFTNNIGTSLSARIYMNPSTDAGVLFSHGLFSTKDGYKITRLAQTIVSCGYNLMTFDFTFCGESGGQLKNISIQQEANDLACAVREFRRRGITKMHLMGSSMGAAVSILHASKMTDMYESLILIAAPLDLIAIIPGMTIDKALLLDENCYSEISGIEVTNRFIRELAVIQMPAAVRKIQCPVMLIHGGMDTVVDISNTRLFADNCRTLCRQVIIDDGDHNLTRDSDLTVISEAIGSWLGGYNA